MDPVQAAADILEAGAGILQFRHKGFFSKNIFRQACEVAALCRGAGAEFVMNDRADLAALLGAALHLGQDDLTPADARRVVGGNAVIGLSTHNESQLRAALEERVNYVAFGPVFGTISKANPDPVVGLAELWRLRALTQLPIVAIGGITRGNARSVIEAGADSVAVIGDLYPENGDVRGRAEEWINLLY